MMYILCDMECFYDRYGNCHPVQLAALRTDPDWYDTDGFYARMRPGNKACYHWNAAPYSGGTPSDFLEADDPATVFADFDQFLQEDDVLLFFYPHSVKQFQTVRDQLPFPFKSVQVLALRPYIASFTCKYYQQTEDPYVLAVKLGLERPFPQHDAWNDVSMLQDVLIALEFPQACLSQLSSDLRSPSASIFPYYQDPHRERIHRQGCPELSDEMLGFPTLSGSIFHRKYTPCICCRKEYTDKLIQHNRDLIRQGEWNYIASAHSNVYHKNTCTLALHSRVLVGFRRKSAVQRHELRPCKVCRPSDDEAQQNYLLRLAAQKALRDQLSLELQEQMHTLKKISVPQSHQNTATARAVGRHKQAVEERRSEVGKQFSTDTERHDFYALTQPRLTFWAGKGYKHFHSRNCRCIQGIDHLQGFATYEAAVSVGYKPCKFCKPSSAQNAALSIPIFSQPRNNETVESLQQLCRKYDYTCEVRDTYFYLQTSVGKWRFPMQSSPVSLEHINLVVTPDNADQYHVQPRIFLSMTDVILYIKQHDDTLLSRIG
jgi:methylphosphotriester-DNA--protein-cysteine methyltransferase